MKRSKKLAMSMAVAVALCFSLVSFAGVDASYAATTGVHVKAATISLEVGKTYQQKLLNKKGKAIKATKVTWKSKKAAVAKITKKGKITAVKAGTTKMTAKYNGKTYKFTVKVTKPVIKLASSAVTVGLNQSYQQKLTKDGKAISGSSVVWKAGDSSIATISSVGVITGLKIGSTTMTATYGGKTYSFTVTVPKVGFTTSALTVKERQTQRVTILVDSSITNVSYEVGDTDIAYASWPENSWSTYNDSMNMVALDITGSDAGSTTVTVYDTNDPSTKAVLKVTVAPLLNSWISFEGLSVRVGETKTITVNTSHGGYFSWNYVEDYIQVEKGEWLDDYNYTLKITGLSAGKSILTVTDANDPSVYSDITVTVTS